MLRDAIFLTFADVKILFRSREIWLWAFVLPIVFFYFIGTVMSGFGGDPNAKDPIAITIAPDAGFLADRLVRRLESLGYRIAPRAPQRLTIPAGFTQSLLDKKPVKLHVE